MSSTPGPILPDNRPLTLAEAFLSSTNGTSIHPRTVRHWRGEFYSFDRCVYTKQVDEELRSELTRFLNNLLHDDWHKGSDNKLVSDPKPLRVTRAVVAETLAQMQALTQVLGRQEMPCWLGDTDGRPDPRNIVAFQNGLLDAAAFACGTASLHPSTPEWFSEVALPCRFDPEAACPQWIKFLDEALSGDKELIGLLQEWFGYVLTGDTSQQKMLWLHGRSGAGKGTITRVLQEVVGQRNCVSFNLFSLTQPFTLSAFMGKTLAVSADAELSKDTDSRRAIEMLKAISGEDSQLVDRKNRDLLSNIRMKTRLVVVVNEFPSLPDAAGALRRRSLIIPFDKRFDAVADPHLGDKLTSEIQGIVTWSLAGLARLRRQGRFSKTKRGADMEERLLTLCNPIRAFVEECCTLDDAETDRIDEKPMMAPKGRLYQTYRNWCTASGHSPMSKPRFGEAILNTFDGVKARRMGGDTSREQCYEGIEIEETCKYAAQPDGQSEQDVIDNLPGFGG
jgi:putative DNA primase/helicase